LKKKVPFAKSTRHSRDRQALKRIGIFKEVLLLEDNATTAKRRKKLGVRSDVNTKEITVRIHRLVHAERVSVSRKTYKVGEMRKHRSSRVDLALNLIRRATRKGAKSVVVAGTAYGSVKAFTGILFDAGMHFVTQVRPGTVIANPRGKGNVRASASLKAGRWRRVTIKLPTGEVIPCTAKKLGVVNLPSGRVRLFAIQVGGIQGVHRGTIIGLSSFDASINYLAHLASYSRWIRTESRRGARASSAQGVKPKGKAARIDRRANITLARKRDQEIDSRTDVRPDGFRLRKTLSSGETVLNVVDLFAGAGGMGLGFLLGGGESGRYRITYSGEVNPIFARTIEHNYKRFDRIFRHHRASRTPETISPIDLRPKRALEEVRATARDYGDTHILIGGPPCQGFSMANRNSWSGRNPNNELIDTFLKYVRILKPRVFLLENVQGMINAPKGSGEISVVDAIERRMTSSGYLVYPKLLDAVWYGVPQHRTRLFVIGVHRDLGYRAESFGAWGPFPTPSHGTGGLPWITVRDAIRDLPRIGNGSSSESLKYAQPSRKELRENTFLRSMRAGADAGTISGHVTSKHADYVLERYKKIPQGGNWEDIRKSMTNYANISRTHSNIYRRLRWDEPSITIGHYRKSMIIHPSQTRGLSLREAARLQSFPDWFDFVGADSGAQAGLIHRQQQLANAVCPLVTKAIAQFLLML